LVHVGAINDRDYLFTSSTYRAISREEEKFAYGLYRFRKTYDKVPREVIWWTLMKKGVHIKYIDIIRDMYNRIVTNVRTCGDITSDFSITIGLHQGSALNPFLFTIVMEELTRAIQNEIPWCMLFADDIILVDETRAGINAKLELCRQTLDLEFLD